VTDREPTDAELVAIEAEVERCAYIHPDGTDPPADWAFIGESGDFFLCDEHFQPRTAEYKRGWSRIPHEAAP
jgi:hypothetical protein